MPKLYCTGCSSSTYRKSSGECMECGYKIEHMTLNRFIEPQPDPVMTFIILSFDEYPDNETEVVLKWYADGKPALLGNLDSRHAANYRHLIVVPTNEVKNMTDGELHNYISERPFLYDKNIQNE